MSKLVDRIITKVDRIRQRVNVDKVGVRRFKLFRVIRTWAEGEVGDGVTTTSELEITPEPAIQLGGSRDAMSGRGRIEVGTMIATEVSLIYSEADLNPSLSAGQELYYRLVELNAAQDQDTTYWVLSTSPEADRCETVNGNIQWILTFTRASIKE